MIVIDDGGGDIVIRAAERNCGAQGKMFFRGPL